MATEVDKFVSRIAERNPGEPEFIQAVNEVAETVIPYVGDHPELSEHGIVERLCEPDRTISFRVSWVDDQGATRVNRGYRVQFNSAIGPYKGGLRFHPSVNQSIIKFLGFEQTFKNALTGLPLGGGKGGSDFDPKGRSDAEVMRFAQAFMTQLYRHIGPDTDVPAGDIGVGGREIGYLFGQYKRIANEFTGVLTGKGLEYGGSLLRPEATGYGAVYFAQNVFNYRGDSVEGKRVALSGSGNVALYAIEKLNQLGAIAVTASDSGGHIYDPEGIDSEKLAWLMDLKFNRRGRISEYAEKFGVEYREGRPWGVSAEIAIPCATQNEIEAQDAKSLVANGVVAVVEGANMPTTPEAIDVLSDGGVSFAPGKAANAGGVSVSGLEMAQNSGRVPWTAAQVDEKLREVMGDIHSTCVTHGQKSNELDYVRGANIGGFIKVAQAMLAQGVY